MKRGRRGSGKEIEKGEEEEREETLDGEEASEYVCVRRANRTFTRAYGEEIAETYRLTMPHGLFVIGVV